MSGCSDGHWQITIPSNSTVYDALRDFSFAYAPIHAYLSAVICPVGAILNLFNVIVLTRPGMRTPVNVILTNIAICDTVVMSSNLIFVGHFILTASNRCYFKDYSYGWAVFALFHAHATIITHTTSSWLSVAMAVIRYATIRAAERGSNWRIPEWQTVFASGSILISVVLCATPIFLSYAIHEEHPAYTLSTCRFFFNPHSFNETSRYGTYMPYSYAQYRENCATLQLAFWTTGILFKMVPCGLLGTFMLLLVGLLSSVHVRHRRLKQSLQNVSNANHKGSGGGRKSDRTTRMLIVVLAIFTITELPQGLVSVSTGIFNKTFRLKIYNPLGNLFDLLSLINSSANFIILCSMSKKFRETFVNLFVPQKIYQQVGQTEAAPVTLREKPSTSLYARYGGRAVTPPVETSPFPSIDYTK